MRSNTAPPKTQSAFQHRRGRTRPPRHLSDALEFHPIADMFPLMEGKEFDALVADIKANALRYKIALYEGKILDGRNRYRAMLAAGHRPTKEHFFEYKPALSTDTPLSYVITANLHRRHLTAEQKRDLIAKLLKAQPDRSDRQIAATVKADHKTVGAVRTGLEGRGEIPHVGNRQDTKARKQPAIKDLRLKRKEVAASRPPVSKQAGAKQIANAKPVAELLDAAVNMQEHNATLVEKLRAAEIKIAGLESEVEELKAENAKLREQLETARATSRPEPADDGLDIPECLRREPKAVSS
jgi:hypothetical protein